MAVTYGANFSGAYSVMGTIDGFAAEIQTDAYVASVLQYSHEKLSQYFDLWMDAWAQQDAWARMPTLLGCLSISYRAFGSSSYRTPGTCPGRRDDRLPARLPVLRTAASHGI